MTVCFDWKKVDREMRQNVASQTARNEDLANDGYWFFVGIDLTGSHDLKPVNTNHQTKESKSFITES
jgi:hypothetical protein